MTLILSLKPSSDLLSYLNASYSFFASLKNEEIFKGKSFCLDFGIEERPSFNKWRDTIKDGGGAISYSVMRNKVYSSLCIRRFGYFPLLFDPSLRF